MNNTPGLTSFDSYGLKPANWNWTSIFEWFSEGDEFTIKLALKFPKPNNPR